MLLHVIFLQYISIALANYNLFSSFLNEFGREDENQTILTRFPRFPTKKPPKKEDEIPVQVPSCDDLTKTNMSPFVVILLYRSSGRFVGMGSIIDKKTILTAAQVVQKSRKVPKSLIILAGRLSPWWGKDSQVQHAREIFMNDLGLAIVILAKELYYNKYVKPITLPGTWVPLPPAFEPEYDIHWAVFGIPRSSWDIPAEKTSKTTTYVMRIETTCQKKIHVDACKAAYPAVEFNDTAMICTYANGTFHWGSIGSPSVAVNQKDELLQIGVITNTPFASMADEYHIHVKVGYYQQWISSLSLIGYPKTDPNNR